MPAQNNAYQATFCECGCGKPLLAEKRYRSRFSIGHNVRRSPVSFVLEERGYSSPCWIWQRTVNREGYGVTHTDDGEHKTNAHRVYYERHIGPVPKGLQLDHLCRVRHCVNPHHLEPVTNRENTLRGLAPIVNSARPPKTHCKQGHRLDGDNLFIRNTGHRECRECMRAADQRQKAKRRAL